MVTGRALDPAPYLEYNDGLKDLAQPAQGEEETDRGAEGGEEEDQQDAGDAIAPPAAHGDDIVADVFEVADGRRHDPGLGEAGKEADAEGGVEGGNRGGDKGGEDGEGVAEGYRRAEGGEGTGGQNPGEGGIHEARFVAEKEAGNKDNDDGGRDQPGGGAGEQARLGNEVESADIVEGVAVEVAEDPGQVSGADDGDDLAATGAADVVRHVTIAFVDEDRFDRGEGAPHLFNHAVEGVGLAQPCQFGFVNLGAVEEPGQQGGDDVQPFAEAGHAPGAQQGGANIAIDEAESDAVLFRRGGSGHQLGAGAHAGLQSHPFLKGDEGEVGEKEGSLAATDGLDEIEGLPTGVVFEGLITLAVEFDADAIRFLAGNDLAHHVDRFLRDMGGADQNDFATGKEDALQIC